MMIFDCCIDLSPSFLGFSFIPFHILIEVISQHTEPGCQRQSLGYEC